MEYSFRKDAVSSRGDAGHGDGERGRQGEGEKARGEKSKKRNK